MSSVAIIAATIKTGAMMKLRSASFVMATVTLEIGDQLLKNSKRFNDYSQKRAECFEQDREPGQEAMT